MIPHFPNEAIAEQTITGNELCIVMLPRDPIYKYHFLLVTKRKTAHAFSDLSIKELGALQSLSKHVVEAFAAQSSFHYSGYNLFCNNGGAGAGQHVNQFHMHLFVRSTDEQSSPFDLMHQSIPWADKTTAEWWAHRDRMRRILGPQPT